MEEKIPIIEFPDEAFKEIDFCEDLASGFIECMDKHSTAFDWERFNKRPISTQAAFAFLGWESDLGVIVDNVNIVTGDLYELSKREELSAHELWTRYRLLTRTAFSEFYRVHGVSAIFFKELKKAGLIDDAYRRGFSQIIHDIITPLRDVRNLFTHERMPVIQEERRGFAAVIADEAGMVLVDKTGEVVLPSADISEIASRRASELRTMGRELFSTLQSLHDGIAKHIVEKFSEHPKHSRAGLLSV